MLSTSPHFLKKTFHLKFPAGVDPATDGLKLTCHMFTTMASGFGDGGTVGRDRLVCMGSHVLPPDSVSRLRLGGRLPIVLEFDGGEGRAELDVLYASPELEGEQGLAGFGTKNRIDVFVSHAENVKSAGGTFVALKTVREASTRAVSKSLTSLSESGPSGGHVWEEKLGVEVMENEIESERLLLGLVDADSNKLIAKAGIPVRGLVPGVFHNLALKLDAANAVLYVSVYLHGALAVEKAWLAKVPRLTKVNVAVKDESLGFLAANHAEDGAQRPLFGVWRLCDLHAGFTPDQSLAEPWTRSDSETEATILASLAEQKFDGLEMSKVVQPLVGAKSITPWGKGHTTFLTADFTLMAKPILVVEFHKLGAAGAAPSLVGYCVTELKDLLTANETVLSLDSVPVKVAEHKDRTEGAVSFDLTIQNPNQYKRYLQNTALDPSLGESEGEPGNLADLLLRDLFEENAVTRKLLGKLQKSTDKEERLAVQVEQMQGKIVELQSNLGDLHLLVEQERNANKELPALEGWELMSQHELYGKTRQVMAMHGVEKRKTAELVHQLQKLHADAIESHEIAESFARLQVAHVEQSKQLGELERENAQVHQYRETVESQEKVIGHLEKLLSECVGIQKRMAATEDDNRRLQGEVERLMELRGDEEIRELKAEVSAGEKARDVQTTSQKDLEQKLVAATIRAEKADTKAIIARNEMIEMAKRHAQEVAGLKARIAEKDAQLMGGFGSLANLSLGEMPAPAGRKLPAPPGVGAKGRPVPRDKKPLSPLQQAR